MAKRTYSSRDKKREVYEQESRRKRTKGDSEDELRLPGRPHSSASLLKKGLRPSLKQTDFEDDVVSNIAQRNKRSSILDRALDGKLKSIKHKERNIYGSRKDFEVTMQDQRAEKKNNPRPSSSYLPTPPSELQLQQAKRLNAYFPRLNGQAGKLVSKMASPIIKSATLPPTKPAVKPTKTLRILENIIKCAEPKEPYTPRKYDADKTPAPRRDLPGDRLSRKSKEAELWSANQSSSPILRLPGEVRNRIYEYALGGNTINICYETYRSTYVNDQPVKEEPVFKYHCIVFDKLTNPYLENRMNKVGISYSFILLNSVCRQLYLETAILPYKLNTIAFGSHNIMMNFLLFERRLSRLQRSAITTLVLPDNLPASNILEYLPNLEKLYLGFDHYDDWKGWYRVIREDGQETKLAHNNRWG